MIAVDTSALMAIVNQEEDAPVLSSLIQAHGRALIGVPTLFEFQMVALGRFQAHVAKEVIALAIASPLELVPFDANHLASATRAFDRFGRGRHPASLNFGDCMAYAIAEVARCALLFKGNDFAQTDIKGVV